MSEDSDPLELNSTESILGMIAWLVDRPETTVIGGGRESSSLPPLIDAYVKANNLPDVHGDWSERAVFPSQAAAPIVREVTEKSAYQLIAEEIREKLATVPMDDAIEILGSCISCYYIAAKMSTKETRVAFTKLTNKLIKFHIDSVNEMKEITDKAH